MKCPYCGTENRPDVRFCKECGRALDAATTGASEARTSPMAGSSSGRSCPHCGSPVKPEARFCPRCGEALSTDQPAASPAQQPAYSEASPPPSQPQSRGPSPTAVPSQPTYAEPQQQPPQPGSTQPNLPGGGPSAAYNEPQASPPSGGPGASAAVSIGEQSTLPPWLWIVIGVAIGIVVLIVVFLGFRMLTNGDEAAPSPTPTATATEAATSPTATPEAVAPSPTETPAPTWTPTPQSETPTPTLEPYGAKLVADPMAAEVNAGEPLSLTFTLSNTGEIGMNMAEYRLLGNWERYFTLPQRPPQTSDSIQPQGNHSLTFTFQPTQPAQDGQADITLLVILSVNDDPPAKESIKAGPVQVTIAP